jgi:hypothetical protein
MVSVALEQNLLDDTLILHFQSSIDHCPIPIYHRFPHNVFESCAAYHHIIISFISSLTPHLDGEESTSIKDNKKPISIRSITPLRSVGIVDINYFVNTTLDIFSWLSI